eukprot:jgi/Picre1/27250/NNA_000219.t1
MYLSTPVVKSTGFQHPKILKITSERRGIRRRGNDRAVLPPRAILADAATAEWQLFLAVLHYLEQRCVAAEPEPPAPIAEKKDETSDEQKEKEVVLPDPVEVEARVNTVQAWIGAWKDKSAQLAAEAERKAKEAEAKAIEAQRRVLEAEKELARAEAEEDRKKRVAHVRAWIDSWREASAKRAAAAAAHRSIRILVWLLL